VEKLRQKPPTGKGGTMETPIRDYLVDIAKQYAAINQWSISTVSRTLHGTDSFFQDFEAGKCSVTLRKADEMLRLFRYGRKGKRKGGRNHGECPPWPKSVPFPKYPDLNRNNYREND
jgi:hypothetical protein